ncbi:uncharacterized protein B0T15DRAFT_531357 [Chaetomium strumarium]|uniref:Uncharacterized protein n=1 Tax=Chaetomium strumarium TaxID=1170767 RepID=A0AAJ0M131_9PEZI|nr:hypothetical protein B0T15DRAFT_531357 [Chaetomium strumarium]
MADNQLQLEIIEQNPIGNGLEGFRTYYISVCNSKSIPYTPDTLDLLDDEDLRNLALAFLSAA